MLVQGGNVQSVMATKKCDLTVEVFDTDNLQAEGHSGDEIDKRYAELVDGLVLVY